MKLSFPLMKVKNFPSRRAYDAAGVISLALLLVLLLNSLGEPFYSPNLVYAGAIASLFILFFMMRNAYYQGLVIGFLAQFYLLLVSLLAVGAWKFGGYGKIVMINPGTFSYLTDGSLVNVATIGVLALVTGQCLSARLIALPKRPPTPANAPELHVKPIRVQTTLFALALSWVMMFWTLYPIIWIQPYLTKVLRLGALVAVFSSAWHTLNNFFLALFIDLALRARVKLKLLIPSVLILAFVSLSFGNRSSAMFALGALFFLLLLHRKMRPPLWAVFTAILLGSIFITYWGYVRFYAYRQSLVDVAGIFLSDAGENLATYFYDKFPVLGQNLAHFTGYMYLYDTNLPSGFLPYLNGILNILPRPIGIMLGLPIDAFDCHAWTLVKYGLISTGGSYLFGEPYWLGGLPMIVLFHLLFGLIFSLGDLYFYRRRSKGKFIGHYVGAALLMLIGFGYGFSGWMRAFYMLLFSELALRLYEKRKAFVGKEYTNKVIIEQN